MDGDEGGEGFSAFFEFKEDAKEVEAMPPKATPPNSTKLLRTIPTFAELNRACPSSAKLRGAPLSSSEHYRALASLAKLCRNQPSFAQFEKILCNEKYFILQNF